MYNLLSFATVLCTLCASCSLAAPSNNNQTFKTGKYKPTQFHEASPNNKAVHVLPLSRQSAGTATSAGYVQSLRKGNQVNGVYGNSKVTSVESGMPARASIDHLHLLLTRSYRSCLRDRDPSRRRDLHSRRRHRQQRHLAGRDRLHLRERLASRLQVRRYLQQDQYLPARRQRELRNILHRRRIPDRFIWKRDGHSRRRNSQGPTSSRRHLRELERRRLLKRRAWPLLPSRYKSLQWKQPRHKLPRNPSRLQSLLHLRLHRRKRRASLLPRPLPRCKRRHARNRRSPTRLLRSHLRQHALRDAHCVRHQLKHRKP